MPQIAASFKSTGITSDVIAVIYKQTNPGVEVDRQVNAANVLNPWNFVFTGLEPGTYIVRIHESPDGSTLGNLHQDFWQDSVTGEIFNERVFLTVDGPGDTDPDDGDTEFDLQLPGREVTGVFKEGFRYLKTTECDFTDQSNIQLLVDSNGDQIIATSGEVYCIELARLVTVSEPTSGGGGMDVVKIQNGNELTLNIASDSNDLNKTHLISSTNTSQLTQLPLVGALTDGNGYRFAHDGGSLVNVHITRAGSDLIRFRGADVTDIYLGKGEWVKMVKLGSKWYVVDFHGQWDQVGRRVFVDYVGPNMLVLNGTEYDGGVYKRLYAHGTTNLSPSQKVLESVWLLTTDSFNGETKYTKQSLWVVDTVGMTIRVPNDLGKSYRSLLNIGGSDSTRVDNVAGGYQPWQVGPHDHPLPSDQSGSDNIPSISNTANSDEGFNPANKTDLNTGTENRVENVGQIPVVLI